MKVTDNIVTYNQKESLDYAFKVLDSDLSVFLDDYDKNGKDVIKLLGNMAASVNFHLGCLNNETPCYNHDDPKEPNRRIVFDVDYATIQHYMGLAWNKIVRKMKEHGIPYKMRKVPG